MTGSVLLCTDGSELSIAALRSGCALLAADAAFEVATVMEDPDPMLVTGTGFAGGVMSPEEYEHDVEQTQQEAAAILAATMRALGIADVPTHVLHGSAGVAICELAEQRSARAIVLGSHGRGGLKRAVLGSVSDHVVRHAPCSVLVTAAEALEDELA